MKATIYSKPSCGACIKAKYLFDKLNIEYEEISAVDHRDHLIDLVTRETGSPPRTVPQIWLDGKYVGGYDELVIQLKE